MSVIKWVGGIIGTLAFVGALLPDKPSESVRVGRSVLASAEEVAPEPPPPPSCPSGYAAAGRRGCFTVDSVSKKYGDMYQVRGKVISKESCGNLIIELSGTDSGGNVICDGNGMVADVARGQSETWSGTILSCPQKPASVSLKLSACM